MHHPALAPAPVRPLVPATRPTTRLRPSPVRDLREVRELREARELRGPTAPRTARTADAPALDALAPIADAANPEPATLCANLARCAVEILAGARPLDQIGRWVSDAVYVHLLRRTMIAARARAVAPEGALRPRMRIGEPRLARPSEGVVEAVVLVHQPGRSRAVAIRLERHRERWRASAINVL
ncbi:Rv3235 family protein [Leifsonia sp. 22587]|uniref:Rv3235 family protein n=1 Tax=Leifsonia sp. 22587 TaxID=3453946 RepID=UPI003F841F9A